MHGSLIHGAVAEVADANPVFAAILDREGDARRKRDVASDDGVAAQKALLGIEEVHRAALAFGAPGRLAQQLGHRGLGTHAPRQRVAVVAISCDHIISLTQGPDRAHRNRFLAAVLMEEPADLVPLLIQHLRALFEAADEHHHSKPFQGLVSTDDGLRGGLHLHHGHRAPVVLRSRSEQLPQHVLQNAAMLIVTHFLGGVDAHRHRERDRPSTRRRGGHRQLSAG